MVEKRRVSKGYKESSCKLALQQNEEEKKENSFDVQVQFLHPDIVVRSDKMESAQGSVYFVDFGLQKSLVLKHVSHRIHTYFLFLMLNTVYLIDFNHYCSI